MNIGDKYLCVKDVSHFKNGEIYTVSKISRKFNIVFRLDNYDDLFTYYMGNIVELIDDNKNNNENLFIKLRDHNLNIIINETT